METRSKTQVNSTELGIIEGETANFVDCEEEVGQTVVSMNDMNLSLEQVLVLIKEKDDELDKLRGMIDSLMCPANQTKRRIETKIKGSSIIPDPRNRSISECGSMGSGKSGKEGDPIKLLPQFSWDANDVNETKRFVSAFRALAKENNWTQTYARTAFESKLTGRGKTKYFEGLGNVDDMSFNERLYEFEKLFSKELTPNQSQELFWSCRQGQNESVTSFKLRLMSLGNAYKRGFCDNTLFDQLISQQFIKGLVSRHRIEVIKAGVTRFSEAVKMAIRLEECELRYHTEVFMVSGLQSDELDVQKQLYELKNQVKWLQSKLSGRYNVAQNHQVRCWECGRNGHVRQMCRNTKVSIARDVRCELCNKTGHYMTSCYMKVQQEIIRRRNEIVTDTIQHKLVDNAAIEETMPVTIEKSGEVAESPCTPSEVKREEMHNKPIQRHNTIERSEQAVGTKKIVRDSKENSKERNVGKAKIYFASVYDSRPMIEVLINGRCTRALIDTGAQLSLLSSSFIKDSENVLCDFTTQLLSPISDKSVQAQNTVIDLRLGDLILSPRVCVSSLHQRFPFDFLIGYEILNECNAVINTREKTLELELKRPFNSGKNNDKDKVDMGWCQSFVAEEKN